jgi:hypothetical protein
MAGLWFSTDTPVSSINKPADITEILLKVALNTTTPTPNLKLHSVSTKA